VGERGIEMPRFDVELSGRLIKKYENINELIENVEARDEAEAITKAARILEARLIDSVWDDPRVDDHSYIDLDFDEVNVSKAEEDNEHSIDADQQSES
jgi:hypothetical protein